MCDGNVDVDLMMDGEEGGTGMNRKFFIIAAGLALIFVCGLTWIGVSEALAENNLSHFDKMHGKIGTYEHPSGYLTMNYKILGSPYTIPVKAPDKKEITIPRGFVVGEMEMMGMKSEIFPLGKEDKGLFPILKKVIEETPEDDMNAVPLALVRYRVLRPEQMQLINERNDVFTPKGTNEINRLVEPWNDAAKNDGKGARTDMAIKSIDDLTLDNCIYAVWEADQEKRIPLVRVMGADLNTQAGKYVVYSLAQEYGIDYIDLSLMVVRAQTKMYKAQGNFIDEKCIEMLTK